MIYIIYKNLLLSRLRSHWKIHVAKMMEIQCRYENAASVVRDYQFEQNIVINVEVHSSIPTIGFVRIA